MVLRNGGVPHVQRAGLDSRSDAALHQVLPANRSATLTSGRAFAFAPHKQGYHRYVG
jgi:hypothetical protein